jgi:hypothetical protein
VRKLLREAGLEGGRKRRDPGGDGVTGDASGDEEEGGGGGGRLRKKGGSGGGAK